MPKHKYNFGDLEQAIMNVIWRRDAVTVRDVVDELQHRPVAYTTVMTVMNRLAKHRVLKRQPNGNGAFRYQSRLTRQAFAAEATRVAIDDLVHRYGAVAMAQFINRLDRVPPEKLSALRRQVKRDHIQ